MSQGENSSSSLHQIINTQEKADRFMKLLKDAGREENVPPPIVLPESTWKKIIEGLLHHKLSDEDVRHAVDHLNEVFPIGVKIVRYEKNT